MATIAVDAADEDDNVDDNMPYDILRCQWQPTITQTHYTNHKAPTTGSTYQPVDAMVIIMAMQMNI